MIVINLSFLIGGFRDASKVAKVIPLVKKGSLTDISNYRLRPDFSKILEKAIQLNVGNKKLYH